MSSTVPGGRERLSPDSPFLFSEIPLEGTVEELERVYRRRKETARRLGEDGKGQQLDEAYAVARACLQAVLDEAHAPGSSLVASPPPQAAGRAATDESDPGGEVASPGGATAGRDSGPLSGPSSSEAASGSA